METTLNYKPQVYVGTYRKYNNGNLDGGWITLTDYPNYAAFMEACFKLHKDEHDPELMIQDCSDMPDGLSVMDSVSEQDFNDIIAACREEEAEEQPKFQIVDYSEKAIAIVGDTKDIKDKLKELGGRFNPRLSCGSGWVFSKKQRAEVEKLLQGGLPVEKSEAKPKADEGAAWKKNFEEYLSTKKDPDYYKKHFIGAVKLNDGCYLLDKPSIDTKFCFADEGEDYEYYKELMASEEKLRRYFIAENLSDIDRTLRWLQDDCQLVITCDYNDGRKGFGKPEHRWKQPTDVSMTVEQRSELTAAFRWSRSQFEKRLQTYLKRYGVSKLHTWTYWRDA